MHTNEINHLRFVILSDESVYFDHIKNQSKEMTKNSLAKTIHGRNIIIYFMRYYREWLWIFNNAMGSQTIVNEEDIASFLHITTRTARDWRSGRKQPCPNALLLLYITHTGQSLPVEWSRRGYGFKNGYLMRDGHRIDHGDIEEMEYLRWQLNQSVKALNSLTLMRHQRHGSGSKTTPPP